MQELLNKVISICTDAGGRIILAIIVFIVGRFVINKLIAFLRKQKFIQKMEPTVASFTDNLLSIGLTILLVLTVINILGVPMASVVTVLATAGVAIGMSLQGALSNLAGGIMLMFFRPFNVGDYVAAGGEEGTVTAIALFYTTLMTVDNKRIMIPNGSLMNANVTNFSSEQRRRVDLDFSCGKNADIKKVQDLMMDILQKNPMVLKDPAPFARFSGGTSDASRFTVRAWCRNEDYWDLYYDLLGSVATKMGQEGIPAPAMHIVKEEG